MFRVFLFLIISAALISCAPREPAVHPEESAVVAVAGFSQPKHRREMLTRHVTVDQEVIDDEILRMLDSDLAVLAGESRQEIIGPAAVKKCRELQDLDIDQEGGTFHYWVQTGKCVQADYILVPFVFKWKERKGGEWGVEEPAAVTLELNLINVRTFEHYRYFFDERQKSLFEDLSRAGRFFKRGGRWISARSLANEGLEKGIRELGL